MARGLQELIDFLLNEVALCGSQGATIQDIVKRIEIFYPSCQDESARSQNVDHRFQAKVWSWLTRNPEVSIGENNQWNDLTFDQVKDLDNSAEKNEKPTELEENEDNEKPTSSKVRIFVSKKRTWYAVTGHEPDDSKCPASEFALLSIIAAQLIKLSGQDKRSVPKRTDALVRKGYIEKRAVQVKNTRTSLLTHCRFMNSAVVEAEGEKKVEPTQMIDFDAFIGRMFEILRTSENNIVGRNDLKAMLDFHDLWYTRVLSRALRKLEQIGVVRRVRAKSQFGLMHSCVQLIREPTPKDLEKFHVFSKDGIDGTEEDQADIDEEMELDAEEQATEKPQTDTETETGIIAPDTIIQSARTVPKWTPDRNLANQVLDVVDQAGTKGITNDNINRTCYGLYFKRPSECLIHRLTDCWQFSQPPHLRHLAIVRDSDVQKTTIHYVNYTASNFARKVDQGGAFWEAVEFPPEKIKASKVKVLPVEAPFEVDNYGLPQIISPLLMRNGNIKLAEGLLCCKPSDYSLTRKDPAGVYQEDGSYRVQPGSTVAIELLPKTTVSSRKLGRPRKYPAQVSPSKMKREGSAAAGVIELSDSDTVMSEALQIPSPEKKKLTKQEKWKRMSKKERFEAMGWDKTWTEYSALVMEKPTPGIYVTPRGKRRPAGKKQGRPKQSRIAVFKSPNLSSLSWFTKDDGDSDNTDAGEEMSSQPIPAPTQESTSTPEAATVDDTSAQPEQIIEATSSRPKRSKRDQSPGLPEGLETSLAGINGVQTSDGRPSKQRRLRGPTEKSGQATQIGSVTAETAIDPTSVEARESTPAAVDANDDPSMQVTTRSKTASPQATRKTPKTPGATERSMAPPKVPTPNSRITQTQETPISKSILQIKNNTPRTHGTPEKGGSVPFMRRKIVMEIVEKAGGAYPGGTELWHPFTTAWLKLNYKEKPDTRTVRTAVTHLVEAGFLKQSTFSGKDTRGLMVTKSILWLPTMTPDDPLIQRMRSELLIHDRDTKTPFAPGIEITHGLSRNLRPSRPHRPKSTVPIISSATVRIMDKPMSVRHQEKRAERNVQRVLLRRMMEDHYDDYDSETDSDDYEDDDDDEEIPGVRRLMRLPHQFGEGFGGIHHFFHSKFMVNPLWDQPLPPKIKRPPGRPKALATLFSPAGKMAFLMNPGQFYHSASGTFATGSINHRKSGRRRGYFADNRANADFGITTGNPVHVLNAFARQPNEPPSAKAKNSTDVQRFMRATDKILHWELNHEDLFDTFHEDHPFIDQTVPRSFYAQPPEGLIRFDFDEPEVPKKFRASRMKTRRLMRAERAPKRQRVLQDSSGSRHMEVRPIRRRTTLKPLPEGVIRRYMVAIVAVRTLAGGNDGKSVDWDLVPLAFPNNDPEVVIQYGKSILARNRMEILKMQYDFQERYLLAYEKDQVPPIDYENLPGYNWPAVVEWASIELEFSTSEKAPTLPATREQFDNMFELREEQGTVPEEVHATSGSITSIHRRRLMARIPFTMEQARAPPLPQRADLQNLELAKTWVRANVTTPEDRYDAEAAANTLAPFGNALLSLATQTLMTDRVICNANRGRAVPGRNYMMHDFFIQAMERRRGIDGDQLARAALFKSTILDTAFKQDGSFKVSYHGRDGDSLALGELVANGHIDLFPCNPPREKYGLMDGGYLTRQMDKLKLRFEVEARPTSTYPYGNPIMDLIKLQAPLPPPTNNIPLWYDIHGRLIRELWMKSIASVLGCLLIRAGVSVESITVMCKPGLMKWEVELLLEKWLLAIGVVSKSVDGGQTRWFLNEWWWLTLEDVEDPHPSQEPEPGTETGTISHFPATGLTIHNTETATETISASG
ncbi:hypothetical protein N7540_006589 [Penicillium herquei]|nr:hypothetical protein N7540_006589 [Penicillium herquei]